MAFVMDASVAMSWCFADESTLYTRSVLDQLTTSYGEVPALWPVEIANSLSVNERKKRVTEEGSAVFLRRLALLDIRFQSSLQFEDWICCSVLLGGMVLPPTMRVIWPWRNEDAFLLRPSTNSSFARLLLKVFRWFANANEIDPPK